MRFLKTLILAAALTAPAIPSAGQKHESGKGAVANANAVVWVDPGDIHSRDLYYGVGGNKDVPNAPFKYGKEDKGGTSPKFDVTDASGEEWRAKLGPESQAEVVASRLLWAIGYSCNEDYYFSEMRLPGISEHQKRGREFIDVADVAHGVRLQRTPKHEKKGKGWSWSNNPVKGTREFNGLRVMMAWLSNWDLKEDNNAIYEDKRDPSEAWYGVTDVGASFGTSGKSYTEAGSKNNLKAYARHKFISKVTSEYVDFNFPTHPAFIYYFPLFEWPFVWQEWRHRWVGRHIPREDVRWIASLLTQLSHDQICAAFRAAGYTPQQVEAFTAAVENRIAQIARL